MEGIFDRVDGDTGPVIPDEHEAMLHSCVYQLLGYLRLLLLASSRNVDDWYLGCVCHGELDVQGTLAALLPR